MAISTALYWQIWSRTWIDSELQGRVDGFLAEPQSVPPSTIEAGERIAQVDLVPVLQAETGHRRQLRINSQRGAGGFGHTGSALTIPNEVGQGGGTQIQAKKTSTRPEAGSKALPSIR